MLERANKDEMEQMGEHHKHLLAEEVLKAHNMPTLFSYRYAFILGLEKGMELAQKKGGKNETES